MEALYLSSQPAYQTGSSCGCSVGRQIATAPWNAEIRHEEARRVPVQMPRSWFQVIVHGSKFQELQYSTAQQTGPEQPDTSTASCLLLSAAFPAKAAFSAASVPTAAAPAASPQFCHMTEGWRDRLDITASRAAYMRRRRCQFRCQLSACRACPAVLPERMPRPALLLALQRHMLACRGGECCARSRLLRRGVWQRCARVSISAQCGCLLPGEGSCRWRCC